MSPQKRKLFSLIGKCLSPSTKVYFWADIDLGGFRMFQRLQAIIPQLVPLRMTAEHVLKYENTGLKRSREYLNLLQKSLEQNEFPLFSDSIRQILRSGVTVEQEIFLN